MNRQLFFLDDEHEEKFFRLVSGKFKENDKEYSSAFYILTADEELRRKGMKYITTDGIRWDGIWDEDWSSGYRVLLQLGESLFKSSGRADIVYGLGIWGDELYRIAMEAIRIRRSGIPG